MRSAAPAVLAAIALVATPALADKLPLPKASYSADVVFESKGHQTTGHVNVDGPKERRESKNASGQSVVRIIRRDKDRVYDLKPQRHLAIALRIAAAEAAGDIGAPGADIDAFYGVEVQPQGVETVAGVEATKYTAKLDIGGGLAVDSSIWATEDGIIVRIVGKTSVEADIPPASMELKNIVKGPQDAALFEVPPGMSVLSASGDSDTPEAPASAATPAPAPAPPPDKKP